MQPGQRPGGSLLIWKRRLVEDPPGDAYPRELNSGTCGLLAVPVSGASRKP